MAAKKVFLINQMSKVIGVGAYILKPLKLQEIALDELKMLREAYPVFNRYLESGGISVWDAENDRQKIDTARAFYGELREAPAGKFKDTPNIAEAASIARLDKWNEDKEREAKRKDYAGDMEKVMREYCAV